MGPRRRPRRGGELDPMSQIDCTTVREMLWPPEGPRLATEDVVEMKEHVSRCPECEEYFDQDDLLLDLYDRLRKRKAPVELRNRIFDIVARERAGSDRKDEGEEGGSPRRWVWLRRAAGGLVAAAVVGAVFVWTGNAGSGAPSEDATTRSLYVEDYLRRAVGQDRIETSNPAEVSEFLQRELALALTPLKLSGLRLTGAEICLLEGRRGAMILYDVGGATLSHYMVPMEGVRARAPAPATRLEEPTSGVRGPGVVTWSTPSLQQALVGPLPTESLLRLAERATSE